MEEQRKEVAVEVHKERFEEAVNIWETAMGKAFPTTEKEFYYRTTIERISQACDSQEMSNAEILAFIITNGILIGFLPSEWNALSLKTRSFSDEESKKKNGEWCFFMGFASAGVSEWDDSKNWLGRALEDRLLPRKMQLASLLLRAWCKVHLQEYDEALTDLVTITEDVGLRTPEGKQRVENIKGFVEVLASCDIGIEEGARLVAILPEGEADEIALKISRQIPAPSADPNELIKKFEMIIRPLEKKVYEIGNTIGTSHEAIQKRLMGEGKKWVNELTDPGILLSAEAKYQKLKMRSWKEPIFEFTTAVESEIKSRLLQPLETFLSNHRTPDFKLIGRDGNPYYFKKSSTELIFVVLLFEQAESHALLKEFFSQPFIHLTFPEIKQLAKPLDELRNIRNRAEHSVFTSDPGYWYRQADRARSLVLGTKDRPGMLEQLLKIELT